MEFNKQQLISLTIFTQYTNLVAKELTDKENKKTITQECYNCKHHKTVPGNCHIECINPDLKMTGSPHGIKMGWFYYPLLFDPVWKTKKCDNWEGIK